MWFTTFPWMVAIGFLSVVVLLKARGRDRAVTQPIGVGLFWLNLVALVALYAVVGVQADAEATAIVSDPCSGDMPTLVWILTGCWAW